jgi:NADPH:quinone reductase-like Zn-dependent oxidoreductase
VPNLAIGKTAWHDAGVRAALMLRHGGPEALVVVDDAPDPRPGAGEARVRLSSAAVNNTDIWTREGRYPSLHGPAVPAGWLGVAITAPRVQGADAVGIVESVGLGVEPSLIGHRVLIDPAVYESTDEHADVVAVMGSEFDGGFAEYVVVPTERLHDVTSSPLTDHQLASLPIAYGTAMGMLRRGRAAAGETVLVTGASGGVGVALVQLGAALGLRVVALSTADKSEPLRRLGATHVVDRTSVALGAELRAAAPQGFDLVADIAGGALFSQWPGLLGRRGRIVVAGAIGGPEVNLDLRQLYLEQRQIIGSTMHTRADFARLADEARRGTIAPPIAAVFPLAEIHAAQRAIRDSHTIGKVVIDLTR